MKKLTTVKTSREKDLTKEQFFFPNLKLHNGMASSKKKERKNRSNHPEVFYKKGVLRNLQNSQESNCARVPFLIKL